MKLVALFTLIGLISSCGKNPHLKVKPVSNEPIRSEIRPDPDSISNLIIRPANSNLSSGQIDLGEMESPSTTPEVELYNTGDLEAVNIKLFSALSKFNIKAGCSSLPPKTACPLKVLKSEINSPLISETVVFEYKDLAKVTSKYTAVILNAKNKVEDQNPDEEEPVPAKNPRISIENAQTNEDRSLVTSVVNQGVVVNLNIKNTGDVDVKNITINYPTRPDHNCKDLRVNATCQVTIKFSTSTAGVSKETVVATAQHDTTTIKSSHDITYVISPSTLTARLLPESYIVDNSYENTEIYQQYNGAPNVEIVKHMINPSVNGFKIINTKDGNGTITSIRSFGTRFNILSTGSLNQCQVGGELAKNQLCQLELKRMASTNLENGIIIDYHNGQRELKLIVILEESGATTNECRKWIARDDFSQGSVIKSLGGTYALPYLKSSGDIKLDVLLNKNHNLVIINGKNTHPIVKNGMVQFGFEVDHKTVANYYNDLEIELDVVKFATENAVFDGTEILCLNENRKCSGTFFERSNFTRLLTTNYKKHSNLFSQELTSLSFSPNSDSSLLPTVDSLVGQRTLINNNYKFFRLRKKYKLSELFGTAPTASDKGLNFILADDSYLMDTPKLILNSSSCE
jgi:hypothetical protein